MDRGASGGDLRHSATGNPHHMEDDLLGGVGRLPNEQLRQRMVEVVAAL